MIYETMMREADKRDERNDCAVKAIAIACRKSYADAHVACKGRGRKDGRGMQMWEILVVARRLGFKLKAARDPRQPNGSRYTPKTIGAKFKRGYFIVEFRGHVAAMVNGLLHDWTDGRKLHVKNVYQVIRKPRKKAPKPVHAPKLHEWQKMRRAKVGDVFAVAKDLQLTVYVKGRCRDDVHGYHGTRKVITFSRGQTGIVFWVKPESDKGWLFVDFGGSVPGARSVAITAEQAKQLGGVFPDMLRAQVALQSGAMG